MSLVIKELLQIGANALTKADNPNPRLDAELLMCHMLSINRSQLFLKYPVILDEKLCDEYFKLIDIRFAGKPLQYITGEQEFMGMSFKVNEHVLIPRQDTETLVEEVIHDTIADSKSRTKKPVRSGYQILDLCCGSGAIGISLCKFIKNAKVTGIDISEEALKVAEENARVLKFDNRVLFLKSDLFSSLKKGFRGRTFDIIVSNPPYIKSSIIPTLQREVAQFEPLLALDGGEDGLDFYRRIVAEAPDYLKKQGRLYLEIGADQGEALQNLLNNSGRFKDVEIIRDFAGLDRVVKAEVVK